jgi:hypothetical protein
MRTHTTQQDRFWSRRVEQEEFQFYQSQQEKRQKTQEYLATAVLKAKQAVDIAKKHHRAVSQPF